MREEAQKNPDEIIFREKSPYRSLIAFLTAVALFLLTIEAYFFLLPPQPVNIPRLSEVRGLLGAGLEQPFSSYQPGELKRVITDSRDSIKQVANFIASRSCREYDRVCQSRALYVFVRDEIRYVPDDRFSDQLENPLTVIKTGGADCEDKAMLAAALEMAIGNNARLVFVPSHAYAQVSIPNYKGERWINMEATCQDCQFGELPDEIAIQKKEYKEL